MYNMIGFHFPCTFNKFFHVVNGFYFSSTGNRVILFKCTVLEIIKLFFLRDAAPQYAPIHFYTIQILQAKTEWLSKQFRVCVQQSPAIVPGSCTSIICQGRPGRRSPSLLLATPNKPITLCGSLVPAPIFILSTLEK